MCEPSIPLSHMFNLLLSMGHYSGLLINEVREVAPRQKKRYYHDSNSHPVLEVHLYVNVNHYAKPSNLVYLFVPALLTIASEMS